jgi:hypothetical protein
VSAGTRTDSDLYALLGKLGGTPSVGAARKRANAIRRRRAVYRWTQERIDDGQALGASRANDEDEVLLLWNRRHLGKWLR